MTDPIALLRTHDPAGSLEPLPRSARDRLFASVIAPASAAPRARRSNRRRLILAVAILGVLLAAGGWTVYDVVFSDDTATDVRRDFASVSRSVPLPPGVAWTTPNLDPRGIYPGRPALTLAVLQSTCAWFSYWQDGWKRGDREQMTAAVAGERKLRPLIPIHHVGDPEDVPGFDRAYVQLFDRAIAQQRAGDDETTASFLRANCD